MGNHFSYGYCLTVKAEKDVEVESVLRQESS